jgi:hypothetical protein
MGWTSLIVEVEVEVEEELVGSILLFVSLVELPDLPVLFVSLFVPALLMSRSTLVVSLVVLLESVSPSPLLFLLLPLCWSPTFALSPLVGTLARGPLFARF